MKFTYLDVDVKGHKGEINLFFDGEYICPITNKTLAKKIKKSIKKRISCPYCQSFNVIMFHPDEDICQDCKKTFPGKL